MLNLAEHEVLNAHSYKNTKTLSIYQAQISLEGYFSCSAEHDFFFKTSGPDLIVLNNANSVNILSVRFRIVENMDCNFQKHITKFLQYLHFIFWF